MAIAKALLATGAMVLGLSLALGVVEMRATTQVNYSVSLQCFDDSYIGVSNADPGVPQDLQCTGNPTFNGCPAYGPPTCYQSTLMMADLNGGDFEDGDIVRVRGSFGYWGADITVGLSSGLPLLSCQYSCGDEEDAVFEIETMDCDDCLVSESARISLRSYTLGTFWSASGGGSGVVNATANSRGNYEKFEITVCGGWPSNC